MKFEKQTLLIAPSEQKTLKVFIDKNRLAAGGHYASIQAEIQTETTNHKSVSLKSVLSTIVFVRAATGQENESGLIKDLYLDQQLFHLPTAASFRFQNTGNIEATPFGQVEITDSFGHLVGRGIFNEGSLVTLPESIRQYDTKINYFSKFLIPGAYKAKFNIKYGESQPQVEIRQLFYLGNLKFLSLLIIGIMLMISTIFKKIKSKHNPSQN